MNKITVLSLYLADEHHTEVYIASEVDERISVLKNALREITELKDRADIVDAWEIAEKALVAHERAADSATHD